MPALRRIVSLLPSATEMVCALGLESSLQAVSHECDYPPQAVAKPKATFGLIPSVELDSGEIDRRVSQSLCRGESLYGLDLEVLRRARPELVVTQELCDVCAVTGTELRRALQELGLSPRVLTQTPRNLQGILQDILELGAALGARGRAESVVARMREEARALRAASDGRPRPRVWCAEWLDPPFAAGHWVPELVALAGGLEVLGRAGEPSRRADWEELAAAAPEIVVLMPCGFDADRTLREAGRLRENPAWRGLPAVREGRVWAVDANAYFSRPGPRILEGAALLAHLFSGGRVPWRGPASAFAQLPG